MSSVAGEMVLVCLAATGLAALRHPRQAGLALFVLIVVAFATSIRARGCPDGNLDHTSRPTEGHSPLPQHDHGTS
jgi:hypothetical protein